MVFLTALNCARNFAQYIRPGGGPDKFWRVQQYLRFAGKFRGRKQNCYRIAARYVNKALMYATIGREQKKKDMRNLWQTRLEASTAEHGLCREDFLEGLARSSVQLDRRVLTDIAIYEPRTFQSLADIAKQQMAKDGVSSYKPSMLSQSILFYRNT